MILRPLPLSRLSLCLASLAIPPLMSSAHAASLHWDGSSTGPDAEGGAGTWSTATDAFNWDSAATAGSDVAWTNGSDAVFGGSGGAVTVSGTVSATSLNFAAAGYATTGGTITLTGTPLIDVAGNDVTLGSVLSGSAPIRKTGTGTLTLSASNTFSGTFTIEQGTVKAGNDDALGDTSVGTLVAAGATLDINGQNLGSEMITISGSGVNGAGALVNTGVPVTTSVFNLKLAAPATVGGTAQWNVGSGIQSGLLQMGGQWLTKTGPGDLYLTNTTIQSAGTIEVKQGSLWLERLTMRSLAGSGPPGVVLIRGGATLAHARSEQAQAWTLTFEEGSTWRAGYLNSTWPGPVTFNGSILLDAAHPALGQPATLAVDGVISGPGSMTKTGPGSFSLRARNTFTGGTTVNEGKLTLRGVSSGIGTLRGTVTVNGGTLELPLSGVLGTTNGSRVTELAVQGGQVAISPATNHSVPLLKMGAGTLSSNNGVADPQADSWYSLRNGGIVQGLPVTTPGTIAGRLHLGAGNPSVFDIAASELTEGLHITAAITADTTSNGIVKQGSGTLVLAGPNLYTGTTRVEGGTLKLGNASTLTESHLDILAGGRFATGVAGRTVKSITAHAGSSLQVPAVPGATTTVAGDLMLDGGSIAITPLLGDLPVGTYDLITASAITGSGVPVLDLAGTYGPTRASGTVAVNGNKLQLTLTGTGGSLLWNNATAGGTATGTWDRTLANFHDGASNSSFQAFDAVTFDDTVAPGSTKTITLGGLLAPARVEVDNSQGDYHFITGTGALAGAGSLVKTGSAALTISGSSAHLMSGPIHAGGGVIDFSGKNVSAASLTLAGGSFNNATASFGTLDLRSGSSNAALKSDGPWTKTTPGTVILAGTGQFSGPGTVAAGTLHAGDPSAPGATGALGSGPVTIANGATLGFSRSDSLVIPNEFSGSGVLQLTGSNNGTNGQSIFELSRSNHGFSGRVNVSNSSLRILSPLGGAGSGTITLAGRSGLVLRDSVLTNPVNLTGGSWGYINTNDADIDLTNSTLSGPLTLPAGTTSIKSSQIPGRLSTISGPIGESGSSAAVSVEIGSEQRLVFSGANSYTGATSVSGFGILHLSGSLGASAVSVGTWAGLGGNGVIGTGGSLSLQNDSRLIADTSAQALTVNGNVSFGNLTTVTVDPAGTPASGPFPVLNYTGTLSGAGNLTVNSPGQYRTATLAFTPGLITLDIGAKQLFWVGGSSWALNSAKSWNTSGSGLATDFFFTGDSVVFDDSGSGGNVEGVNPVKPSSVVVNNSAVNYAISPSIQGSGTLTKSGTGSLVLGGSGSTYSGGTTITAGQVFASGQGLGTGPVTVAVGATLGGSATVPGTVNIAGTLNPSQPNSGIKNTLSTGPMTLSGLYRCCLRGLYSDGLYVSGDLDLTGASLIFDPDSFSAPSGASYLIASYTGNLTGSFGSVSGIPAAYRLRHDAAQKQFILQRMKTADWAAGFPGLEDTRAVGDPDGDGISNLVEWLLGGNPAPRMPAPSCPCKPSRRAT